MSLPTIKIEPINFEEVITHFEYIQEIEELGGNLVRWIAYKFADILKDRVPKRTGELADTIRVIEVDANTFDVFIGDEQHPYAPILEFGAPPHLITPVSAKVLKFEIYGEDVFAKKVSHPGIEPEPFWEPSIEDIKEILDELGAKSIQELVESGNTEVNE